MAHRAIRYLESMPRREEFLFVNGQKTFGNTRIGPSQRMRLWDSAFIWEKAFYVTIFKLNCSDG